MYVYYEMLGLRGFTTRCCREIWAVNYMSTLQILCLRSLAIQSVACRGGDDVCEWVEEICEETEEKHAEDEARTI